MMRVDVDPKEILKKNKELKERRITFTHLHSFRYYVGKLPKLGSTALEKVCLMISCNGKYMYRLETHLNKKHQMPYGSDAFNDTGIEKCRYLPPVFRR